jgi:hypothetical protein
MGQVRMRCTTAAVDADKKNKGGCIPGERLSSTRGAKATLSDPRVTLLLIAETKSNSKKINF